MKRLLPVLLVLSASLVLMVPTVAHAQANSSLDIRPPNGSAYGFQAMASFHRSEDGGTIAICVTPADRRPGLTLVASFELGALPVEVEGDAIITILGMSDPSLGLYSHDGKPNLLRLSSYAGGVLLGSYVGTLRGLERGGTTDDVWVRSLFVASEVTDESCPAPLNR